MEIKVLGAGCARCSALEMATKEALEISGITAKVEKVEDYQQIARYGVLTTPALVIDGRVVVKGRVPDVSEISEILTSHA